MPATERLYYNDSHLIEFEARVVEISERVSGWTAVTLDRTAFYPTGGGQPRQARGAFEQRGVQLVFQFFDLPAQGRLRDKQALGGGAEAAAVGDFDEVAQLAGGNHASCLFEMGRGL